MVTRDRSAARARSRLSRRSPRLLPRAIQAVADMGCARKRFAACGFAERRNGPALTRSRKRRNEVNHFSSNQCKMIAAKYVDDAADFSLGALPYPPSALRQSATNARRRAG